MVIAVTLAIQLYWVFKNYEESKRQLDRDIRTSFDLTVADYFTNSSKENTVGFFTVDGKFPSGKIDSLIDNSVAISKKNKDSKTNKFLSREFLRVEDDSIRFPEKQKKTKPQKLQIFKSKGQDTLNDKSTARSKLKRFFSVKDSVELDGDVSISNLSISDDKFSGVLDKVDKKFTFSFSTNSLDLETLDSIMDIKLQKNDIQINNGFKYNDGEDDFALGNLTGDQLVESNSPQLYKNTSLQMVYSGQEKTLFKRNLAGISLSFILICGVIFCLFYMLYIIRKQKELSLIKNDLISNITHEFKTPIATASAALEGVQNFTITGDVEKSNRYIGIGREQLSKLNIMVEKLLETATIDSELLALQKSHFNIATTLKEAVARYQSMSEKVIELDLKQESMTVFGDEFHLENAINNLLDNAIKYGGDKIALKAIQLNDAISITLTDNGNTLTTRDSKSLFEKFYRVPQGDKHNVKGYGIGLFYTKAIIEKHGGIISLNLKPTTFKINLPNE